VFRDCVSQRWGVPGGSGAFSHREPFAKNQGQRLKVLPVLGGDDLAGRCFEIDEGISTAVALLSVEWCAGRAGLEMPQTINSALCLLVLSGGGKRFQPGSDSFHSIKTLDSMKTSGIGIAQGIWSQGVDSPVFESLHDAIHERRIKAFGFSDKTKRRRDGLQARRRRVLAEELEPGRAEFSRDLGNHRGYADKFLEPSDLGPDKRCLMAVFDIFRLHGGRPLSADLKGQNGRTEADYGAVHSAIQRLLGIGAHVQALGAEDFIPCLIVATNHKDIVIAWGKSSGFNFAR
jgi:hypothetical protein